MTHESTIEAIREIAREVINTLGTTAKTSKLTSDTKTTRYDVALEGIADGNRKNNCTTERMKGWIEWKGI